jgi:protein-disulfide isomerase
MQIMSSKSDLTITVTMVVCALVTTGVVVHREFGASRAASAAGTGAPEKAVLLHDLKPNEGSSVYIGPSDAPVQIIEFADFECPFCGDFHKKLKSIKRKYPEKIGLTYVHFPIPGHRFAMPAARVAECANDQRRFESMYDALFEGQDQFGLKPWDDYAAAAGVPKLGAFDECIKKTDPIPHVEEGKALGAKLDVQGTPTIIINGWKLGHPPSEAELDNMVQRILAGKQPVDAKS